MREELQKLEANIAALERSEPKPARPFLVTTRSAQDCSTCRLRLCEQHRPCPDGYGGLTAKRAAGGGSAP